MTEHDERHDGEEDDRNLEERTSPGNRKLPAKARKEAVYGTDADAADGTPGP
jgi:hypothetical protein